MSKHTNTIPYTNDRRAGRTAPGLIEMRDDIQVPSRGPNGMRFLPLGALPNRANRRAWRHVGSTRKGAGTRRLARSEWPPVPTDAERAALSNYRFERWADRQMRFAAAIYLCPCGFRAWSNEAGLSAHYETIEAHEAMCSWSTKVSA